MNKKWDILISQLYDEMYDFMLRYASIRISDIHSAQDAVQETFLAAQKNSKKVCESGNPKGWLIKALRYKVLDELLIKSKLCTVDPTTDAYLNAQIHNDEIDQGLLDLLNKEQFKILYHIYVEGYSVKEVANMYKIKYDACLKRIQKAKHELAQEV